MSQPASMVNYHIRLAHASELKVLLELERAAGQRFAALPALAEMPDDITPLEELQEARPGGSG